MADGFEARHWLARVSSVAGIVLGAAWAADAQHLVTCAHVVLDAGAQGPGDAVQVYFPNLGSGCEAEVLDEGWAPPQRDEMAGDLALLRLSEPPARIEAMPARSLRSLDHLDFAAYGFPEGYDEGIDTTGALGKAAGRERAKLEVTSPLLVKPGFSGGAVFSERLGAVVAMLTSRDQGTEGRVAFAVPMRVMAERSPIIAEALQTPLDLDRHLKTHWGPRSRGVDSDRDDAGWLFSGRLEALEEIARWLTEGKPPALRAVTGTPGSGKSAVLARVVTSADRHYRQRIPDVRKDDPTVPPEGIFDVTFHARERTVREFVDHVAALAEMDADSAPELLSALDEEDTRLVIAVDAVDEASEPNELCWLLADLARRGHRVLAGCRPHLVGELGDPEPIQLDKPPYLESGDVETYVAALLASRAHEGLEAQLASEVAAAARGNFLVAQLTAQAVSASDRVERPFPRNVSQAFQRLLDSLSDKQRSRDLLLPLAVALGDGLPDDLWLAAAQALRRRYEQADLDDLLSSAASSFLITSVGAPGGRQHRLFHEALGEALTRGRDLAADHRRLLEHWTAALPEAADGGPAWDGAPAYLRTHAAEHAAFGGVLDALVEDPGLIAATEPSRLLPLMTSVREPGALLMRRAYRQAFGSLATSIADERASYLELASRQVGADDLADQFASRRPARTWSVRWGHWPPVADHVIVARRGNEMTTIALAGLDGRTVAISGGPSGTVRVWDLASGLQRAKLLTDGERIVTAVRLGELDARPVAVGGCDDGTLRVWDLASGLQRTKLMTDGETIVTAVRLGELDARPIAVTGGDDGTLRVWDLASGVQRGEPLAGHEKRITALRLGELDARPIAVTGGDDGTLRVWDLASGVQRGEPLAGHEKRITALQLGELEGQAIAVSGGDDGTLRVWDLASGVQRGEPLVGHEKRITALRLGGLEGQAIAVSGGDDGTLRVWDLASGLERGEPLTGHAHGPTLVAMGELEGQPVAVSGGWEGTLRVWEMSTGVQRGEPLSGHDGPVRALALGELDGESVVVSGGMDGTVRVWYLTLGKQRGESLTGKGRESLTGKDYDVTSVALGELEGQPIAVSGDMGGTLRVWDLAAGRQRREVSTGHGEGVTTVSAGMLGGEPVAVSGGADGTLRLWNLASGLKRGDLLPVYSPSAVWVQLTELGGQPVAVTFSFDGTLRIFSLASLSQTMEYHPAHKRSVMALGELEGEPIVIGGGEDRTLRVWGLDSGVQRGEPLTGHEHRLSAVALGEIDGEPVAISGDRAGNLRVWDLTSWRQRGEALPGHESGAYTVALGELDGEPVAISGDGHGKLRVWELNGRRRHVIATGLVTALAVVAPSTALVGTRGGLMLIELAADARTGPID